jgi:hypothetical protein
MAQLKITSQLSQKILREIPVGIAIYDVFDGKIHSRYVSDGYSGCLACRVVPASNITGRTPSQQSILPIGTAF